MNQVTLGKWLYALLTADVTLAAYVSTRVYRHPAPEASGYPRIVWKIDQGEVVGSLGASDAIQSYHIDCWLEAVTQNDADTTLVAAGNRLPALLKDGHFSQDSVAFRCVLEQEYVSPLILGAETYMIMGCKTTAWVQGTE